MFVMLFINFLLNARGKQSAKRLVLLISLCGNRQQSKSKPTNQMK
jgi:hypothetical protein